MAIVRFDWKDGRYRLIQLCGFLAFGGVRLTTRGTRLLSAFPTLRHLQPRALHREFFFGIMTDWSWDPRGYTHNDYSYGPSKG